MHLALAIYLLLADDRNVVLALASDHTGLARNARIEVDRHPPLMNNGVIVLLALERIRINRRERGWLFQVQRLRKPGMLLVLLEVRFTNDRAAFHVPMMLRAGNLRRLRGTRDFSTGDKIRSIAAAKCIPIYANAFADAPDFRATVAERQADHIIRQTWLQPDRRGHFFSADRELRHRHAAGMVLPDKFMRAEHEIGIWKTEIVRSFFADKKNIVPGDLRHRI